MRSAISQTHIIFRPFSVLFLFFSHGGDFVSGDICYDLSLEYAMTL